MGSDNVQSGLYAPTSHKNLLPPLSRTIFSH